MSNEEKYFLFLISLAVIGGFIAGAFAGDMMISAKWKADMVKRGHAHYDMTTGEWMWNKEIGEKP